MYEGENASRPVAIDAGKTVLNRTAMLLPEWENPAMSNNKTKKQSYQSVLASVKLEMAEPRVAESAQTEAVRQHAVTAKEADKT
jgi:hypothetical protein